MSIYTQLYNNDENTTTSNTTTDNTTVPIPAVDPVDPTPAPAPF